MAKSLTGCVSSGRFLSARRRGSRQQHEDDDEHDAAASTCRGTVTYSPCIDDARELLDGRQIFGKEPRPIGHRDGGLVLQREYVADDRRLEARLRVRLRVLPSSRLVVRAAAQPADVPEQRGEGRRGGRDEVGNRLRPPASLDVAFAQVNQMALDLRLAGTAQIVARDGCRRRTDLRRTRARARARISPYSSGKASSDRRNSWTGRISGVASCWRSQREASRAHASRSLSASESTSARQVIGASFVAFDVWSVGDDGTEAPGEHLLQIGDERRCSLPPRVHDFILREAQEPGYELNVRLLNWLCSAADRISAVHLRELNIGCVGGGTGLPSLLGGLKINPWLNLNAVVTMFDSGGSSGQLRDELGVLPPGDVLKCALALARNEGEARRVLLSRLPMLEHHARLAGHTGGNLLLSMMEQYSGDFVAAVDGLRALLGCKGRVWPVSTEPASICAEYGDGTRNARRGGSRRRPVARPSGEARLARAAGVDSSRGGRGDPRLRRGHHRSGQLFHEPHAAVTRAWRQGGAGGSARPDHSDREPADGRTRHDRLHRRRRGSMGRRGPSAGRSTS